jgi:hypothetical protein
MRTFARLAALGAALAGLALPATASADAGSISDVRNLGGGRVSATFTATSDFCGASGYCGFFAYARLLSSVEACGVGRGRAIWVSDDVAPDAGTLRGTEVFTLDGTNPVRLCLFLYQADDREWAVAETIFDPAAATAPASTTPPGGPVRQVATARRAAALTLRQAQTAAATALARRYGRTYRQGSAKRRSCRRVSRTRLRCAVSWRHRRFRYRGTVTVTSTITRGRTTRIAVRRTRIR